MEFLNREIFVLMVYMGKATSFFCETQIFSYTPPIFNLFFYVLNFRFSSFAKKWQIRFREWNWDSHSNRYYTCTWTFLSLSRIIQGSIWYTTHIRERDCFWFFPKSFSLPTVFDIWKCRSPLSPEVRRSLGRSSTKKICMEHRDNSLYFCPLLYPPPRTIYHTDGMTTDGCCIWNTRSYTSQSREWCTHRRTDESCGDRLSPLYRIYVEWISCRILRWMSYLQLVSAQRLDEGI